MSLATARGNKLKMWPMSWPSCASTRSVIVVIVLKSSSASASQARAQPGTHGHRRVRQGEKAVTDGFGAVWLVPDNGIVHVVAVCCCGDYHSRRM